MIQLPYQHFPIVVQPPPPRDCIVVDSKKYCREEDVTGRQVVGVIVVFGLFIAIIAAWIWAVVDGPLGKYSLGLTVWLPIAVILLIGGLYAFI